MVVAVANVSSGDVQVKCGVYLEVVKKGMYLALSENFVNI